MMFAARALRALPLLVILNLSACGGGGGGGTVPAPVIISPGIQIGEPSPVAFVTTAFVTRARAENCSEIRNRLFVVDNRMVLWDRVGKCPDNASAQVLFGANVDTVLCSAGDSIAGPVVSCKNAADRTLFDTLRKNLDRADLGVAPGHSVREVPYWPAEGAGISFTRLASAAMSGIVAPKQVVVRDAAAFAALWQQHGANTDSAPDLPKVDFSTHMVIGLFAGYSGGCHSISLQRVLASGNVLVAEYQENEGPAGAVCIAAMTSPMQLTVLMRTEAAVTFRRVAPGA